MKYAKKAGLVLGALGAGAVAVRRTRSATEAAHRAGERWLTVTINRSPEEVGAAGPLPPPLDGLGDRLEVRTRPAPGGRGTELAVRSKQAPPPGSTSMPARLAGRDPRQEIRTALREAKSLLETGEVMRPDAPPTTRETPAGRLVGLLTRRSGGEGVL